jgi:hypothetical protein
MNDTEKSYEQMSNADLQHLSRLVLTKLDAVFEPAAVAGDPRQNKKGF